jgi:hypothetical protein
VRTLALRGGARVAVVGAEWSDAFGVVTRGRVQLELRAGHRTLEDDILQRDNSAPAWRLESGSGPSGRGLSSTGGAG